MNDPGQTNQHRRPTLGEVRFQPAVFGVGMAKQPIGRFKALPAIAHRKHDQARPNKLYIQLKQAQTMEVNITYCVQ